MSWLQAISSAAGGAGDAYGKVRDRQMRDEQFEREMGYRDDQLAMQGASDGLFFDPGGVDTVDPRMSAPAVDPNSFGSLFSTGMPEQGGLGMAEGAPGGAMVDRPGAVVPQAEPMAAGVPEVEVRPEGWRYDSMRDPNFLRNAEQELLRRDTQTQLEAMRQEGWADRNETDAASRIEAAEIRERGATQRARLAAEGRGASGDEARLDSIIGPGGMRRPGGQYGDLTNEALGEAREILDLVGTDPLVGGLDEATANTRLQNLGFTGGVQQVRQMLQSQLPQPASPADQAEQEVREAINRGMDLNTLLEMKKKEGVTDKGLGGIAQSYHNLARQLRESGGR